MPAREGPLIDGFIDCGRTTLRIQGPSFPVECDTLRVPGQADPAVYGRGDRFGNPAPSARVIAKPKLMTTSTRRTPPAVGRNDA